MRNSLYAVIGSLFLLVALAGCETGALSTSKNNKTPAKQLDESEKLALEGFRRLQQGKPGKASSKFNNALKL